MLLKRTLDRLQVRSQKQEPRRMYLGDSLPDIWRRIVAAEIEEEIKPPRLLYTRNGVHV